MAGVALLAFGSAAAKASGTRELARLCSRDAEEGYLKPVDPDRAL